MAPAPPRRRLVQVIAKPAAGVLLLGVLGTLAVLNDGYDAQDVPRLETNVWVTRDTGQYARVNTEIGEFDTVRSVADPVSVVQSGALATVFTQGYSQSWPIDPATPVDFASSDTGGSSGAAINTPPGTTTVDSAGDHVVYRTNAGQVFLGGLPQPGGANASPWQANPFADVEVKEGEDPPRYVADAAAVDASGRVVMYSSEEQAIRTYDIRTGRFDKHVAAVPRPPEPGAPVQLRLVGGRWVLSSPGDGLVWIEGIGGPVETGLGGGAVLQEGSSSGDRILLADATGLISVDLKKGTLAHLADGQGTPAAPVVVGDVAYAAWISSSGASLWESDREGVRPLDVDATALADVKVVSPAFRDNGDRAVLTETATGMVWTLPDGALIPVSSWDPLEDREQVEGTVVVQDVIEQQPPVAVSDVFGVRRGELVSLPLLLNDHDPNKKDVLTIAPASVSALSDPSFGQLGLISDDQGAVIRVSAASGSATFTYAVTDGYDSSPPATVTLTVIDDAANTAPVWCGVPECRLDWPSPQVTPGGFVSVAAIDGWVDPEGDPVAISDVRADDPNAPVTVVATADGKIVVRHQDPNAGEAVIPLTVTVVDARGASQERTLDVRVSASPPLTVKPIAISGSVGERQSVSIDDYVSGGSGSFRLLDVIPAPASATGLTVAPGASNGVIEMSASAPGRDFALFTVEDTSTLAQQTATIRYTVADETRALTAPPMVAFVRAGEDATVDVLGSVQNASGRVLMVSQATSADPGLSVSVVGQSHVRVSGSTPSGEPGKVGVATILISDGAGGAASTQLTVFLLPPSHGIGPIAAPDNVSVRAGAQIDIPVLDNDVSPLGERLLLRPEIEGSGTPGELAFASGNVVRYLAPTVPGTYSVRYSAYLEVDPGRIDSASITVTVLAAGSNRPPQAPTLDARVLAGQSISIPVVGAVADPDGDPIVTTDVGQPAAGDGVASISAQGDAILYRAPADGVAGGQTTFPYTVRDSLGAEATGTVRVGVLSQEKVDVAPVTYGDYIGVRRGAEVPVTVRPLLNDRDPLGGGLELLSVVPNAPEDTTEYDRLEALLDPSSDLGRGVVSLLPGDVEGTHSYVYTVQSDSSFSTSTGLIVLGVSDAPGPDGLKVADTTLTLSNRRELATGIDVVTGKVQWQTGDPSTLKLDLWGDAPKGFRVSGTMIAGSLPEESTVVPFVLTGSDSAGQPVTSYGFLRIPAFDDMRIQLRATTPPIHLGEEKSVQVPVRDFLDVGPADVVEMRQDESLAVQRDQAVCSPTGALAVTYSSGREAPWTDSCSVAVRLAGQTVWSVVAIPVTIQPKDPQAILSPISRTVPPGDSETIDMVDAMISWEGGRVGDVSSLKLAAVHSGSAFIFSEDGTEVTAQAMATARPGTRETIRVTSSAYGGLSSTITLVVGPAAPDAPKGATFTKQCDVSRGASCAITVVGVGGEYDPFAGKPGSGLSLVSVNTADSAPCPVANLTKGSATQVIATWPPGPRPVGGECVVDYTVSDAQGRTGHGTLTIDALGYPQTPASVTTSGYGPTSVTLLVDLGPAKLAHPAVSGATIWEAGVQLAVPCSPSGTGYYTCTVGGLTNGDKHTYTARAVNGVGDSLDTTAHTTWSYQPPVVTAVAAAPFYDATRTTKDLGTVTLDITSSADTQSFTIENTTHTFTQPGVGRTGDITHHTIQIGVGVQDLRITPISIFKPPIGTGNAGAAAPVAVTVAGSPYYTSGISATPDGPKITVTGGTLNANFSPLLPTSQKWVAWTGNTVPLCTMDGSGQAAVSGNVASISDNNVLTTGLVENTDYSVGVCGSNGYGATMKTLDGTVFTWVPPPAPIKTTLAFKIATTATALGGGGAHKTYRYGLEYGPSVDPLFPFSVGYLYSGNPTPQATFDPGYDSIKTPINVAYCAKLGTPNVRCGASATLTQVSAPAKVEVTFPKNCPIPMRETDVTVSSAAAGDVEVVLGVNLYTVSWPAGSAFESLQPIEFTCQGPTPPDPSPSPSQSP